MKNLCKTCKVKNCKILNALEPRDIMVVCCEYVDVKKSTKINETLRKQIN